MSGRSFIQNLTTGKIVGLTVVVLALLFLAKYLTTDHTPPPEIKPESKEESMSRLRAVAEYEALRECTNEILGITNIVSVQAITTDADPTKWTATVKVDRLNDYGGVEHTNLMLRFGLLGEPGGKTRANLYCF